MSVKNQKVVVSDESIENIAVLVERLQKAEALAKASVERIAELEKEALEKERSAKLAETMAYVTVSDGTVSLEAGKNGGKGFPGLKRGVSMSFESFQFILEHAPDILAHATIAKELAKRKVEVEAVKT